MAIGPISPFGAVPGPSSGLGASGGTASGAAQGRGAPGFGQVLGQAVTDLNGLQVQADQAASALAAGTSTDVAGAMIAAEKASLSLQMAVQLRDKAVQAYQQLMNLQM